MGLAFHKTLFAQPAARSKALPQAIVSHVSPASVL